MEERVATSLDHSLILEYRVFCDDQSTFAFIYPRGLKTSRTWLYWHAGTFDVSACMHWLFNITLALRTTCHTFAAGRCSHRGLIDSTAESASYMLTRDNHVVGVMNRCESNESHSTTALLGTTSLYCDCFFDIVLTRIQGVKCTD